jgi:hypothetical protein
MKKFYFSILISLTSLAGSAQSWIYHPFPTDSAIWTNDLGTWYMGPGFPPSPVYNPDAPHRYCMSDLDTTIGAQTYSILNYCGSSYKGAVRDDGAGKVYFVPKDSTMELLIYDFTVEVGDTAFVYENSFDNEFTGFSQASYVVWNIDSVLINSSYRKRFHFSSCDGVWIEGIGCSRGLFVESWPNVSNYYNNLECMSHNDTTLFPSYSLGGCSLVSGISQPAEITEEILIFPNPATSTLNISSGTALSVIEICNVLGTVVYRSETDIHMVELDLSELPSNVYFLRLYNKKGVSFVRKIVKQ